MFYLWIQTGERYVDVSHESGLSSRTIGVVAIVGTAASSTACVRTASVGATCIGAAADDTAAETISVLFILKIGLKKIRNIKTVETELEKFFHVVHQLMATWETLPKNLKTPLQVHQIL
jgi:hypothetical protein